MLPRFHLAVTVDNLTQARNFYGTVLGLAEGRATDTWIDWNFAGHQFVTHLDPEKTTHRAHNKVDGHLVPVPHFGLLLTPEIFHSFANRIRNANIDFIIAPYLRFKDQPGEQWTMFLQDYSGNAIEFKAFTNDEDIFTGYSGASDCEKC